MEDFKQKLLEENQKLDKRLQEFYESGKPEIDKFFEQLEKGELKNSAKLEITGVDLAEVMWAVEVMKKNIDSLQELAVVTSTCMKKLQMLVYSTAKNSKIKVELDVE